MFCRMGDLRNKYVINVRNGSKLGYVSDAEIDTAAAAVTAIVIRGRLRFFGLLGREEDTIIRWQDIEVIGEDTILVNHTLPAQENTSGGAESGSASWRTTKRPETVQNIGAAGNSYLHFSSLCGNILRLAYCR